MTVSSKLPNIALFGAFAAVGGALWFENRIQTNFKNEEYYQKAILLLQKYQPAADVLGRPIFGGKLHLDNDKTVIDGLNAKLAIKLKGSKGYGTLHVLASREKFGQSWNIDQLDLEVNSTKQRWKFYDRLLQTDASLPFHPENQNTPQVDK